MDLSGRNIALTGIPRAGTTLACRLLGTCRDTVSLFEPMDATAVPGETGAALQAIAAFFREVRGGLLRHGTAPSKQHAGKVPDNPFTDTRDSTGQRQLVATPGWIEVSPPPPAGFALVIKHNAMFAALLPRLSDAAEVVAVVRHPVAVLASWNSVALPVRDGRQPAGERLDPELRALLAGEADVIDRQLVLLDWYFRRFKQLPRTCVVRYEDVVASEGSALFAAARLHPVEPVGLASRNANPAWHGIDAKSLARAVTSRNGAWRHWYPDDDANAVAAAIEHSGRAAGR